MVQGTDAFPSLSHKVAEEVNKIARSALKSQPLQWGPDASYYPKTSNSAGYGVVAAGRTGRDFVTFGLAASQTAMDAHIICLDDYIVPSFSLFSSNVKVNTRPNHFQYHMKYPELVNFYRNARVIAIPMLAGFSLCGLTSLMDALGMGKPVIMTRNPLIDIDIEKEGIGKWVEIGDIEGWKNALQFFEDNEQEAFTMGQKARLLVEKGMNSENFANQIMDIFDCVISYS
jgi:glycosyltransferase involved in cell wall biosynthesis